MLRKCSQVWAVGGEGPPCPTPDAKWELVPYPAPKLATTDAERQQRAQIIEDLRQEELDAWSELPPISLEELRKWWVTRIRRHAPLYQRLNSPDQIERLRRYLDGWVPVDWDGCIIGTYIEWTQLEDGRWQMSAAEYDKQKAEGRPLWEAYRGDEIILAIDLW